MTSEELSLYLNRFDEPTPPNRFDDGKPYREHGATNIVTREPTLEEVFLRFYEPEKPAPSIAG
jgi:hypothetical protein